jgi:hypothetical protein
MKQHKSINVNVKVKLSRIPSYKEKKILIENIARILDGSGDNFYGIDLKDDDYSDTLKVDHHFVTIRKMGRK